MVLRLQGETLESRELLSGVPALHSFPNADKTIFLDFDGHVTTGTAWNLLLPAIHSPPFDVDGEPSSFNDEEQRRMVSIWERMAEDFRPFNVNVTTVNPLERDPTIFSREGTAQRVLFTSRYDTGVGGTGDRWFTSDAPGAATRSWELGNDTPAFVFSMHEFAGEIGSHEVGHALGLSHDSALTPEGNWIEYRGSHGSGETRWSPIMGQGNGLSQWSDGRYPHATNPESDIGILTQQLGRRPDDYTDIVTLNPAAEDGHFVLEGVIELAGDVDIFSINLNRASNRLTVNVSPWHNGPNLDVGLSLSQIDGQAIVQRNDPQVNPGDRLASQLDLELPPGTYFLTVDGVGKSPTEDDPGYSDYGSLGYYRISGFATDAFHAARSDFNSDGRVDILDYLILSQNYGTSGARSLGDADDDGDIDDDDFAVLLANFGFSSPSQDN